MSKEITNKPHELPLYDYTMLMLLRSKLSILYSTEALAAYENELLRTAIARINDRIAEGELYERLERSKRGKNKTVH